MDPKHSHGPDRIDYQETGGDITEVHAAIQREHPEPTANVTPIPLWLTGVCGLAVLWAGAYLGTFHGGFRGDVFDERATTPGLMFPAVAKQIGGPGGGAAPAAQRSLAEEGKGVYSANCAACHQASGQGVPGAFPPLVGSDWVTGSEKRLVAIILKGLQGPITVHGKQYNNAMPPQEVALNDRKVAAVASYVRSAWGNAAPEISEGKVASARKEFASHPAQWTEAELLQIPADATLVDAAPAGGTAAGGAAPAAAEDLTALGQKQYAAVCVACHQPTGTGLPPAFPPLVKSEYVTGDPKRLVAIILKGVAGPLTVNGVTYNNAMPAQGQALSDKNVAAIATFVRKQFGAGASPVPIDLVKEVRAATAAKTTPYSEAELKSFGGGDAAAAAPAPVPAAAPAQ
jgi:mono/diheme cytochrome c family protein